jgi:Protein of unknown function (DUF3040)
VPLSEHEQRLLDAIEQGLYAEDPKLATSFRSSTVRGRLLRRILLLALLVVLGLVLLVVGVLASNIALGCVGFAAMFLGAVLIASALRRPRLAVVPPTGKPRGGKPARGSWTERAEERFRRRIEGPQD